MRSGTFVLVFMAGSLCFGDSITEALQAKRYDDALKFSDALLQQNPQSAALWTARGYALDGLDRRPEGLSAFARALRYSPAYLPALKGAAETAYRIHDGRAQSFLNQLLQVDPSNVAANGMAGVIAFEARDYRLAIRHFELGRESVTRNPGTAALYGFCLMSLSRIKDAIPVLKEALALVCCF